MPLLPIGRQAADRLSDNQVRNEHRATDTVQQALAQLRIVVVARQPVVRAGLRGLVADIDGVRVVGAFALAEDALEHISDDSTDVVLAAWDSVDPEGTDRFARTLAE